MTFRYHPAGLYIHVPFCLGKCPYCDFYSQADLRLIPSYLSALKKEMTLVSSLSTSFAAMRGAPHLSFDTIYLGGGTPSLLKPPEIADIIEVAYRSFPVSREAEITLEVNPGTIQPKYLTEIQAAGINRINIGIQSFDDKTLRFLGRIHSAREAHRAIRSARKAGFGNVGIDLIYGLPNQSLQEWKKELHIALSYSAEHLSCYMLTFEPGTLFFQWKNNGKIQAPRDATLTSFFEATINLLEENEYVYYEISNFAKSKEYQSRHNKKYWSHTSYLGLGPSAHSFQEPVRYWNHSSLRKYLSDLNEGRRPLSGQEILDDEALILESIYLSLRTAEGIVIKDLNKRFNIDFCKKFASGLSAMKDEGYLSLTPKRCRLTPKGRVLCDGITARIVANTPLNVASDTNAERC
jgi:oxygen-independent coproporphyrinogen-3 oxidase